MSSPLIPFLVFTVLSQKNIYNQKRASNYYSNRRYSSKKTAEKTNQFDALVFDALKNDTNALKAVANLTENYNVSLKNVKDIADLEIKNISTEVQHLCKKASNQLKDLKAMGVNIAYPKYELPHIYGEDDYTVKAVIPSENESGYKYEYQFCPQFLNGLDITSAHFSFENPYEKQLQEYIKEHPNYIQVLENTQEEFNKLKKGHLFSVFNKKKKENLKQAKFEFDEALKVYENVENIKKQINFYNGLTNEQKQTLKGFVENINSIKTLSKNASQYIKLQKIIIKDDSLAIPMEEINEYHSEIMRKAATKLSKKDILALVEFEEKTSENILNLTIEQKEEIIKNSSILDNGFKIEGKQIDSFIFGELSESCKTKIIELRQEKNNTTEINM